MRVNFKVILSAVAVGLLAVNAKDQKICRALALSGGANKGAYEIGVIKGMVDLLPEDEVKWDVVTGVSAGAINAGGMSTFPVGQEKEMVAFMQGILENIHTDDIYTSWDGPIGTGLWKSGYFNNTNMQIFLENVLMNGNGP